MTMKLQFAHQDCQTRAVEAVVKVFDGQPLAKSDFVLANQQGSVAYAGDGTGTDAIRAKSPAFNEWIGKLQA
ncbi:MAG: hypothetical protein U1D25_14225 [Hydrogenophaga sp.]|uniref:hypothetical protein n=1 Tax=Hydrogenophaga sp. TaxID=1904254 RepID=UPI0027434138|nr:hypothetical protein [Hydrogenophaga sp.]MDP2418487.1 hypothetical protein [Hydrogenophaga sp.]MDZ4189246.1 hypothetical protein [Hydrogenophaga sp.]